MSEVEKNIELIKVCAEDYRDKHHHYWNIYYKFLIAIAFVTSIYIFAEKNISQYVQTCAWLTAVIFSGIVLLMGACALAVMSREHRTLLLISARQKRLYRRISVEPYPDDEVGYLTKLESATMKLGRISSVLSLSMIGVTIVCIALIIFSTLVYKTSASDDTSNTSATTVVSAVSTPPAKLFASTEPNNP